METSDSPSSLRPNRRKRFPVEICQQFGKRMFEWRLQSALLQQQGIAVCLGPARPSRPFYLGRIARGREWPHLRPRIAAEQENRAPACSF